MLTCWSPNNKPDGFTIGKYGRQYVRIPQYPIRNALVIGPPGTGKTSGPLLIPEIWNFQNSPPEDRMVIFAPDVKPEHQIKSVLFDRLFKLIQSWNFLLHRVSVRYQS